MLLFIESLLQIRTIPARFNTSHVTLYHKSSEEEALKSAGFNTSHVTLYPLRTCRG